MKIKPQTPKGFRDFLPSAATRRAFLLEKLTLTFKKYGFEPLETPAIEFAQTLKGKYGEEEKLIYEFSDRGGRELALRYDQTVPLSRVIATYPTLPKPFKRYQTQVVWRADNPQAGRFREFLQVDFDTVGSSSFLSDAEIIACALEAMNKIGFKEYYLRINTRNTFKGLPKKVISALDKLKKLSEQEVVREISKSGFNLEKAKEVLVKIKESKPPRQIEELFNLFSPIGIDKNRVIFDPTLARGLDYYTGVIFEMEVEGYQTGSVGGGGRYDNLIGSFTGKETPAVGFSFGFDRLLDAANSQGLLPEDKATTTVLVTILGDKSLESSLKIASKLRNAGINTEVYLEQLGGKKISLEKQLKYADKKNIPFAIIIGEKEQQEKTVTLKNLSTKKQETIDVTSVIDKIRLSQT